MRANNSAGPSSDFSGPDFYATPGWATRALSENEIFEGEIWECACGDGAMSKVLEETGHPVRSSDLNDRGYGEVSVDFLSARTGADNIVTAPPRSSAEHFLQHGLTLARRKLALLLPASFWYGEKRLERIHAITPPNRVWLFARGLYLYPPSDKVRNHGRVFCGWFIWERGAAVENKARMLF
ncbi:MAG: hypothetical protein JNJ73_04620 [Hyphomonadaceae bacterium]|nr:hypothetical protein [Hyphomonadaceae bacterium]